MWIGIYAAVSLVLSSFLPFFSRLRQFGFDVLNYHPCCRSDIEQEVNGLYSYDRKEKVPVARVKKIMDSARDYYYDHVQAQAPKGFRKLLAHGKNALHRT